MFFIWEMCIFLLDLIGFAVYHCSAHKIRREGNNTRGETLIMLKWSCIICLVGCFQIHSSPSPSRRETPSSALSLRYHGNELQRSRQQQLLLLCVFAFKFPTEQFDDENTF